MRRPRFPAGPMSIAVQVVLMSACATTVPSGDMPSDTKVPTDVAPPTTTAFTGDASTPAGAPPMGPVRDGGEESLVFSRQSQDLSGITWTIESYRAGPGDMRGVLDGAVTSLTFGENGTMSATAGCNDLFCQFTAGDGALEIGPIERTQERCSGPAGVMEQELAVIAALEDATTYWVDGDTVQMYQNDGAGVLTLTKG